jgi:hypothetical protein
MTGASSGIGIADINHDSSQYVNVMKSNLVKSGLKSYLIHMESGYLIKSQLWQDESTFQVTANDVFFMIKLAKTGRPARP